MEVVIATLTATWLLAWLAECWLDSLKPDPWRLPGM